MGATFDGNDKSARATFQFTRPGGRDNAAVMGRQDYQWFQFTRPGGRDLRVAGVNTNTASFNSRARVGATKIRGVGGRALQGFNSRARVGATSLRAIPCNICRSFNSRARVGATSVLLSVRLIGLSFNSRARVGATPVSAWTLGRTISFNSRARVGATPCGRGQPSPKKFQFTRPGGRDIYTLYR